jgi:hypothetical protein
VNNTDKDKGEEKPSKDPLGKRAKAKEFRDGGDDSPSLLSLLIPDRIENLKPTDYRSVVPVLMAAGGGVFSKFQHAIEFFEKYKAQLGPVLSILGLVLQRFLEQKKSEGTVVGWPTAPPNLPVVPPIDVPAQVVPVQPVQAWQIAKLRALVSYFEEDRKGSNGGAIVERGRYERICRDDGNDAVRMEERIHIDITAYDARGIEIPREIIRAWPRRRSGDTNAPAIRIHWFVNGKENTDSKDEQDRLELESWNATGDGKDVDNGYTPTFKHTAEGREPGRQKFEFTCDIAAEDNQGLRVESGLAANRAGGTGCYID